MYIKVITMPRGRPVIAGHVREVCTAAALDSARQAYAAEPGLNVVARPATVAEYVTYSHGGHVEAVT